MASRLSKSAVERIASPPVGVGIAARDVVVRVLRFARDTRGSAAIELALGAVGLVAVAVGAFSVYSRIEANSATPRAAMVMAEYVSRHKETSGAEIDALARVLRDQELGADTATVFRISAIRRGSGATSVPTVHWVEEVEIGDSTATTELAEDCGSYGDEGSNATLGSHFTLDENSVAFAVEVCTRYRGLGSLGGMLAGDIRYHHVLPTRHPDETTPARPDRPPENT